MAVISALLAWLGSRLSSLVQAVLGWSVTALFGRLPSTKQMALAGALLLSLLWPVMVIGVFVPAVSAWAFTFVPLQKWLGGGIVRWLSLALAVLVPLVVGAITRWVAPAPVGGRASVVRSVVAGYPLTLGYAIACIVTAISVPIVRLASLLRGWDDEHVYVQPREGEYEPALHELARAGAAVRPDAKIEPVPARMMIATTVLKWFAKAAVRPIVPEQPRMIRGAGLELYLYPADLLVRGQKHAVARLRAAMTRTALERYAFMVSDPGAQDIEEELQRMWHVFRRHAKPSDIGSAAQGRLREIARKLDSSCIPFDQWVLLDRNLRRLQAAFGMADTDGIGDGGADSGDVAEVASAAAAIGPGHEPTPRVEGPVAPILAAAFDEARSLALLEVALARDETRNQIAHAKRAGAIFAAAAGTAIAALVLLATSVASAFSAVSLAAIVIGVVFSAAAAALGVAGYRRLPREVMARTRHRVASDVKQLHERVV